MELFDNRNSAVLITNGANYFRFLDIPTLNKSPIEFKNGSILKSGDLITGIDIRQTKKGLRGFQIKEGHRLEFLGLYSESEINYLIFATGFINQPSPTKRINGYYWFYYFVLMNNECLLLENTS